MSDCQSDTWTVLHLLDWTKGHFAENSLDSPRIAAEILLAKVLGCERINLYARFEYQPDQNQLAAFRGFVKRAAAGEPIAYMVGEKEFYSLALKVTPDVLIPRPETEILVDQAAGHLKQLTADAVMWDVCTGCGCVAIATAANVPNVSVLATDISPEAISIAEGNAAIHNLSERVKFHAADLLDRPGAKKFDVITANPPYVPDDEPLGVTVGYEPSLALRGGSDGMDLIRRIVDTAPAWLGRGGKLIMEFGMGQHEAVSQMIQAGGEFADCRIILDQGKIARTAVATKK